VHFLGGRFHMGGKGPEVRPLMHRPANEGCICASANDRLGRDGFPGRSSTPSGLSPDFGQHGAEHGEVLAFSSWPEAPRVRTSP
jgi:hypothetical protein